jgi:hypothetical protein
MCVRFQQKAGKNLHQAGEGKQVKGDFRDWVAPCGKRELTKVLNRRERWGQPRERGKVPELVASFGGRLSAGETLALEKYEHRPIRRDV